MSDPSPQGPNPEAPAKRGRLEIRIVIAVFIAVVLAGAVYTLVFDPPTAEERARDSTNFNPSTQGPSSSRGTGG